MKLHHRSSAQGATHAVAPGCSVVICGPVAKAQVVQPSAKLSFSAFKFVFAASIILAAFFAAFVRAASIILAAFDRGLPLLHLPQVA